MVLSIKTVTICGLFVAWQIHVAQCYVAWGVAQQIIVLAQRMDPATSYHEFASSVLLVSKRGEEKIAALVVLINTTL